MNLFGLITSELLYGYSDLYSSGLETNNSRCIWLIELLAKRSSLLGACGGTPAIQTILESQYCGGVSGLLHAQFNGDLSPLLLHSSSLCLFDTYQVYHYLKRSTKITLSSLLTVKKQTVLYHGVLGKERQDKCSTNLDIEILINQ